MKIKNDFGLRLKKVRQQKRLTQKDLSSKVNVSNQVISNLERGYTTSLDTNVLILIANVLDTTVDYLVGNTNNPDLVVKQHDNVKFNITKGHENDYTEEDLEMALKIIDMMKKGKS